MRNYNSKPHSKPLVQNAFKKSDRKYPDPKKIKLEKIKQIEQQNTPIKNTLKIKSTQKTINDNEISVHTNLRIPTHGNQIQQIYYLLLQQPFPVFDYRSTTQNNDNYCLWFKNIQGFKDGNRTLVIKKIQYSIADWVQDQFPAVLYLTMDGIYGYLDLNGVPSTRVAVLKLADAVSVQRNNVYVYDLMYESISQNQWQIPKDLTFLKMGLMDQNMQPILLPLPEPLTIQLKIKNKI